jgi:Protein of unknown function (DUF3489)
MGSAIARMTTNPVTSKMRIAASQWCSGQLKIFLSDWARFLLLCPAIGVMNVITAADAADNRRNQMSSTFTIDDDNNIAAYGSAEQASQGDAAGLVHFDSQPALAKLSADWPLSRFVEIWNSISGHSPVKKFQDRNKAVARVWNAIQPLAGNGPAEFAAEQAEVQRKAQKPAKNGKAGKQAASAKRAGASAKQAQGKEQRSNKKAEVIAMMMRAKGVTLAEIMQTTGWQQHTVRGFVSILGNKGGQSIESSKNAAGARIYKIIK